MNDELRLFIAVELPQEAKAALAEAARQLKAAGADVSWSHPESIHLTLKFIGNAPASCVEQLAGDLDRAAAESQAHDATLSAELGVFPNLRRIRVIWAGIDEPTGRLASLRRLVDEATNWCTPADARHYVPHLTLGRVRSGRNVQALSQLIEQVRIPSGLIVPIHRVTLFSSRLTPAGAVHAPLHQAQLAAGA